MSDPAARIVAVLRAISDRRFRCMLGGEAEKLTMLPGPTSVKGRSHRRSRFWACRNSPGGKLVVFCRVLTDLVDGVASVAARIDGAGSGEFVQTVPGRRLERLNGRQGCLPGTSAPRLMNNGRVDHRTSFRQSRGRSKRSFVNMARNWCIPLVARHAPKSHRFWRMARVPCCPWYTGGGINDYHV